MDQEWESTLHEQRWAHLSGRRDDGRWSLSVVDELTKQTSTYHIDVTELSQLAAYAVREVVRAALANLPAGQD
jgi:hypothetical protein